MSQEKRTKFNPELAATILVESLFFGDQKAVARYGINDKMLIGEARTIPLYGKKPPKTNFNRLNELFLEMLRQTWGIN